ncbi:MAG: hypothetical protein IH838_09585 [Proteobacteria bacterium]|nr:hypothetical protein [Pseudomonadota bacterium]
MDFPEVEAFVERLISEAQIAISYKVLCKRLNEDERVPVTYDQTYEAHGFNLSRVAVDNSLTLSLTRLNESGDNVASIPGFIEIFVAENELIAQRIFEDRLKWEDEDESRGHMKERLATIEAACNEHSDLLTSHQWGRVKEFRHRYVAHNAVNTDKIQMPKYRYLYELCDRTTSIITTISQSTIGLSPSLDRFEQNWTDYAEKFFDSMIAWNAKDTDGDGM